MSPVEWFALVCLVGIGCGVVFETYFKPNRHGYSNYAQVFTGELVAILPPAGYLIDADAWSEIWFGIMLFLAVIILIWFAIAAGRRLGKPDTSFKNQRFRSSVPGRNITFQERGGYHRYDK